MPTGGLVVEYADGETVAISSAEIGANFGTITGCEIAGCGTGLRLFDADGHAAWYPWDFFWPWADPAVRAAFDRAAFLRRQALANRIRKFREGHGWTVRQLADNAAVSRKTVKALERGQVEATHAELAALAAALGIEVSSLTA